MSTVFYTNLHLSKNVKYFRQTFLLLLHNNIEMQSTEQANRPGHYLLLTVAIIVGLAGVFLRFLGDAPIFNIAANIIMVIGAIIAFRAVFAILK
jgi:hypothetical protein